MSEELAFRFQGSNKTGITTSLVVPIRATDLSCLADFSEHSRELIEHLRFVQHWELLLSLATFLRMVCFHYKIVEILLIFCKFIACHRCTKLLQTLGKHLISTFYLLDACYHGAKKVASEAVWEA